MASFQINVIIFAGILLIGSLATIAYMFKRNKLEQTWPPVVGECPDFWTLQGMSGTVCNAGTTNIGLPSTIKTIDTSNFKYTGAESSDYSGNYTGHCALKQWANASGVTWDGITNDPNLCNK